MIAEEMTAKASDMFSIEGFYILGAQRLLQKNIYLLDITYTELKSELKIATKFNQQGRCVTKAVAGFCHATEINMLSFQAHFTYRAMAAVQVVFTICRPSAMYSGMWPSVSSIVQMEYLQACHR